tara:strand:- start:383 stop:1015 length:633 start_codon:yes stop_codon:yes gene_type:complete
MKIIAVTLRVDKIKNYNETRDSLDQRWTKLLSELNLLPVFIPNTLSQEQIKNILEKFNFQGLLLTGGNDLSTLDEASNISIERDSTEKELIDHFITRNLPVLGICRGMQMIWTYFGGRLYKQEDRLNSMNKITYKDGKYNEEFVVECFNTFTPLESSTPDKILITGKSSQGFIEAISHKELKVKGLMWHPERKKSLSKIDKQIIFDLFFK